jgi:hypothetical protein
MLHCGGTVMLVLDRGVRCNGGISFEYWKMLKLTELGAVTMIPAVASYSVIRYLLLATTPVLNG